MLSLGTSVGLAKMSALAGCDYGDAATGFELAVNAVYPTLQREKNESHLKYLLVCAHLPETLQ